MIKEQEEILQKLCKISRLSIGEAEKQEFSKKINKLMHLGDLINSLDLKDVTPMFSVPEWRGKGISNLREDKATELDNKEKLIECAPDKEDAFIAVPKVID